jgi:hypothetical protein
VAQFRQTCRTTRLIVHMNCYAHEFIVQVACGSDLATFCTRCDDLEVDYILWGVFFFLFSHLLLLMICLNKITILWQLDAIKKGKGCSQMTGCETPETPTPDTPPTVVKTVTVCWMEDDMGSEDR